MKVRIGIDLTTEVEQGLSIADAQKTWGKVTAGFLSKVHGSEVKVKVVALEVVQEPQVCKACGGSGVFDPATPSCRIDVPRGWRIIERCDACEKYLNDLYAAKVVAQEAQWVRCRDGGDHAIGRGERGRA